MEKIQQKNDKSTKARQQENTKANDKSTKKRCVTTSIHLQLRQGRSFMDLGTVFLRLSTRMYFFIDFRSTEISKHISEQ